MGVSKGIIHRSIQRVIIEGWVMSYWLITKLNNKNSGMHKRKRLLKDAKGQIITPSGPWAGVRWPNPVHQFRQTKNANNSSKSGNSSSNSKEAARSTDGAQTT
jgi:hypothetical protein